MYLHVYTRNVGSTTYKFNIPQSSVLDKEKGNLSETLRMPTIRSTHYKFLSIHHYFDSCCIILWTNLSNCVLYMCTHRVPTFDIFRINCGPWIFGASLIKSFTFSRCISMSVKWEKRKFWKYWISGSLSSLKHRIIPIPYFFLLWGGWGIRNKSNKINVVSITYKGLASWPLRQFYGYATCHPLLL